MTGCLAADFGNRSLVLHEGQRTIGRMGVAESGTMVLQAWEDGRCLSKDEDVGPVVRLRPARYNFIIFTPQVAGCNWKKRRKILESAGEREPSVFQQGVWPRGGC